MSPGRTLAELLAPLIDERRAQLLQLQQEIQALESASALDASTPTHDVLLGLYLGLGGAKAVARHCNAQGWRLPGVKGDRQWSPVDVYGLVRTGKPVDATLHAMALARLAGPAPKPFAGCWA